MRFNDLWLKTAKRHIRPFWFVLARIVFSPLEAIGGCSCTYLTDFLSVWEMKSLSFVSGLLIGAWSVPIMEMDMDALASTSKLPEVQNLTYITVQVCFLAACFA